MPLIFNGTRIEHVGVIDDSQDTRDTISDDLRDVNLVPRPFDGPFYTLDALLETVTTNAEALICDHHLSPRNYAPVTGAEVVAQCYGRQFPSLLVTRYGKADIDHIRRFRRNIPVLLTSDEATPDLIPPSFEICVGEFNNNFLPTRKPWKTLLRIDSLDESSQPIGVNTLVPAWNSSEFIKLLIDMFPDDMRVNVAPGERFYAQVNIGADKQEDLYFDGFEYRGR